MAFSVPGIEASTPPIVVNDYTGRMREIDQFIGWYSLVQRAQLTEPAPLMVPRAGAGLLTLSGTARYAAQSGQRTEMVANFPTGTADHWLTPIVAKPSILSMICAFTATEGFTEPWGLLFSNGARLWVKPNHGANTTGLDYLAEGSSTPVAISTGAAPLPSNAPGFCAVSINFGTGLVKYQTNSDTIYQATHAPLTALAATTTVQALIGVGRVAQPFVGRIMEFAWLEGDYFTNAPAAAVVDEYMATAWGI